MINKSSFRGSPKRTSGLGLRVLQVCGRPCLVVLDNVIEGQGPCKHSRQISLRPRKILPACCANRENYSQINFTCTKMMGSVMCPPGRRSFPPFSLEVDRVEPTRGGVSRWRQPGSLPIPPQRGPQSLLQRTADTHFSEQVVHGPTNMQNLWAFRHR